MANAEHDGVFHAGCTYSHKMIARKLGRKPDWVINNMFRKGLDCYQLGNMWMTTGQLILLWIENNCCAIGESDAGTSEDC